MALGFLPVISKRYVYAVVIGQGDCRGGGQGNTLVSRAEQHVKLHTGVDNSAGVAATELSQGPATGECAGVEKIRAYSAGLESEFAKLQHIVLTRQLDKILLVGMHVDGRSLYQALYCAKSTYKMPAHLQMSARETALPGTAPPVAGHTSISGMARGFLYWILYLGPAHDRNRYLSARAVP